MLSVSSSVLLLDPSGASIQRWVETLADEFQTESTRHCESLLPQLGEWMPEVLLVHADSRNHGEVLSALQAVWEIYPELPVIAVLDPDLVAAQRLLVLSHPLFAQMEAGAPPAELRLLLHRAQDFGRHYQERLHLRQQQLELDVFEMGGSLGAIHEEVQQSAATGMGVVIYGKPGSGRRDVAKKLHLLSPRAREPFVNFNPCGLSVEDCRVRLFGREGLDGLRRKGCLETANGGTILLEEVQLLPRGVQTELYRVLSEGRMTRVNGIHPLPVDLRPVATADPSLMDSVKSGDFYSELFAILHVYSVAVPSLSERREDIPALLHSYLRRFGRRLGKPDLELDPEVTAVLASQSWTGSLAELRRSVELAVLRATGPRLRLADFAVNGLDVDLLPINYRKAKKMVELDFKHRFFTRLLRLAKGKVTRAAELTGVPRPSLSTMIKEVGLDPVSFKSQRAPKASRHAVAR